MTPIAADFTLTFEEFAEATKLQRTRKRFLTGPPLRSPWIGCGVIAAMFFVTFVLFAIATFVTGTKVTSTAGTTTIISQTPIAVFLWGLLPWFLVMGIFWLLLARSSFERRMLGRLVGVILIMGIATSLIGALTQQPSAAQTPPANQANGLLGYLPLVIGFIAFLFIFLMLRRWQVRAAWDGQPQLRRESHMQATAEKMIFADAMSRCEYTWPAYVSYSEGDRIFLLSLSALTFQAIPKRAFADASQVESFRALLQSKMVDADAKARGFDVLPAPISAPLPAPPLETASIADTPPPPPGSH